MIATTAEIKAFCETKQLYEDSLPILRQIAEKITPAEALAPDTCSKFQEMLRAMNNFKLEPYFSLKSSETVTVKEILVSCIIKCLNPVYQMDILAYLSNGSKAVADAATSLAADVPETQLLLDELVIRSRKIFEEYEATVS